MKLRKILAVVLALALLCTTFAACGDSDTGSGSSTTSTTDSSTTDDSAEAENTGATGG